MALRRRTSLSAPLSVTGASGLDPEPLPGGPQGPNQGDPIGTGGDPGPGGTGGPNSGGGVPLFGPGGLYSESPGAPGVGSPDAPGNQPRIGNPGARKALHNLPPWAANRLVRLARQGNLGLSDAGYTPTGGKVGALGRIFGGKGWQPGQQIGWGTTTDAGGHPIPGGQQRASAMESALGGIEQAGVERRAGATQAANLRKLARQQRGMA